MSPPSRAEQKLEIRRQIRAAAGQRRTTVRRWLVGLVIAGAGLGCDVEVASVEPSEIEDDESAEAAEAVAAARAFQRNYEAELRAEDASFLTAVAAHYLGPGEELALDELGVELRVDDDGLTLERGDGEVRRVEGRDTIELDARHLLAISPQEHDIRVLVHDRDAQLRASFPGIAWFAIDPGRIVDAGFTPAGTREGVLLQTSRGVSKTLWTAGEVSFELDGQALRLQVFAYEPEPREGEPLLIPFRDATSGRESYTAGRYLEPSLPADDRMLLDFNRATNPLCAYSEHYNCPVPPRFNTLSVAIRAGAMAPAH